MSHLWVFVSQHEALLADVKCLPTSTRATTRTARSTGCRVRCATSRMGAAMPLRPLRGDPRRLRRRGRRVRHGLGGGGVSGRTWRKRLVVVEASASRSFALSVVVVASLVECDVFAQAFAASPRMQEVVDSNPTDGKNLFFTFYSIRVKCEELFCKTYKKYLNLLKFSKTFKIFLKLSKFSI